jgi:hypothetical protein
MANQIQSFPIPRLVRPAPDPLGLYFHIRRNDHRAVLNMIATGNLACFGGVFDATNLDRHNELLDQILSRNLDAILDTRTQPSATIGGYSDSLGRLPWGAGRPHTPADFSGTAGQRLIATIGDCAIERGFTQVLAPTHLLRSAHDEWLEIDIETIIRLREYLDSKNASHISIIYSLAITYAMLRNPQQRYEVIEALQGIPCVALWLKIDGFGSTSTPTAVLSYIDAAKDFRELELPLVADHVGGLAGLSLLAFGATGGLAHGITQGESFHTGNWRRPRSGNGFSQHPRVYFQHIDMLLKPGDARLMLQTSSRAKAILGCGDSNCCPRGLTDMIQNPARHFLYQRMNEVAALSRIPEQLRAQQFLDQYLRPATDRALAVANVNWNDEIIAKKMREHRKRLDALRVTLGEFETKREKPIPAVLPKTRLSREARL